MRRPPWLEITAGLLFLASLALPAVQPGQPILGFGRNDALSGIQCLALGFFLLPGWLANPLMAVAALLHAFGKRHLAITFMVLALISATSAPFLVHEMMHGGQVRVGYVVWLVSQILMLAAAIDGRRERVAT